MRLAGIAQLLFVMLARLMSSMTPYRVSSSGRCFGFGLISALMVGFIINDPNGLIEDVIRKMLDGFPNGLVNGGCRSSFFSLFAE